MGTDGHGIFRRKDIARPTRNQRQFHKEGIDALATQQSDLDFQVSTDAASVRRFLDARFPAEDDFLHLPIRVRGGRGAAGRSADFLIGWVWSLVPSSRIGVRRSSPAAV
jgi:hypothetical protein